jgi:hypothetical protein
MMVSGIRLLTLLSSFVILGCLSCKKSDDSAAINTPAQVSTTVSSGSWIITYFFDHDTDETSHFAGYRFTFNSSGTINAVKGSNTSSGSWATGTDDSKTKLLLDFSADIFEELSEDWELVKATSTKIELMHKSGGDGHIDYLTFEKG